MQSYVLLQDPALIIIIIIVLFIIITLYYFLPVGQFTEWLENHQSVYSK